MEIRAKEVESGHRIETEFPLLETSISLTHELEVKVYKLREKIFALRRWQFLQQKVSGRDVSILLRQMFRE